MENATGNKNETTRETGKNETGRRKAAKSTIGRRKAGRNGTVRSTVAKNGTVRSTVAKNGTVRSTVAKNGTVRSTVAKNGTVRSTVAKSTVGRRKAGRNGTARRKAAKSTVVRNVTAIPTASIPTRSTTPRDSRNLFDRRSCKTSNSSLTLITHRGCLPLVGTNSDHLARNSGLRNPRAQSRRRPVESHCFLFRFTVADTVWGRSRGFFEVDLTQRLCSRPWFLSTAAHQ
ncbi:histone H1-like repetitive region-containing protein [Halostagnicola bangensis]